MTKREYLINKGYKNVLYTDYRLNYKKCGLIIYLKDIFHVIKKERFVLHPKIVETQQDIDDIQIAFNRVKSDFEEVMKCEDEYV